MLRTLTKTSFFRLHFLEKFFVLSIKKAFTLAETLIVIGIIGIIAMLTIPTLNTSVGDKESVTRFKKEYAILTEAIDRAVAVYGPVGTGVINDTTDAEKTTRFATRIADFLKVQKDCGLELDKGCLPASTIVSKGLNDAQWKWLDANSRYKILLADGASVVFEVSTCTSTSCGEVIFDIDGPNKGKYVHGRDLFQFTYNPSSTLEPSVDPSSDVSLCTKYGACEAWILNFDNMDYLKATNGECPNGKTLDWTNNTSCR
ncbi:MAG: prepilin-type N-terminal cleavage/methylation domain-containing protein [Candidatus Gastranaerophilaceae bacterium]